VVRVAKAAGKSPAQVALNWLCARRNTIPILGARKLSQLEDNLNCVKWSLNAKQLAQLDEVSRIEPGFPRDFLDRPFVRDYLHGGLFERIKR
jgi:aryl-alcohol dehydrogenase-like predicted oxidoreductase